VAAEPDISVVAHVFNHRKSPRFARFRRCTFGDGYNGIEIPKIMTNLVSITQTVPVGDEPYVLFALGVVTATCIFFLIRHFW
jgi:hypothetical protein